MKRQTCRSPEFKADLGRRLKSAAGHVNGIARMVEEDDYCIDLIHQIQAVQAALGRVSMLLIDDHLHTCVTNAVRGEDVSERERVLNEILTLFEKSGELS